VPILACVLSQLCERNDQLPSHSSSISKFHAMRPPSISLNDYLARVLKYAMCSGECFVLSLIYIDRLIASNNSFIVSSLNIHRLLITAVSKYHTRWILSLHCIETMLCSVYVIRYIQSILTYLCYLTSPIYNYPLPLPLLVSVLCLCSDGCQVLR